MFKNWITLGAFASLLSVCSIGHSQALPTATGHGQLQVGAGWSIASPDYAQKKIQGISGWADFDVTQRIGLEGEFHYLSLETPSDIGENSYLVGPRFIFRRSRFNFYGKGMLGVGDLVVQEAQDNVGHPGGTNFAFAVGGGVDVAVKRHIYVRPVDFEYQRWSYQTGLTPWVLTFGAGYRLR